MFGLDEALAELATSTTLVVVLLVALVLGERHATDPDHLTAVSTLVALDGDDHARRAGRLGLAWGLGHATTLVAFGLPIVLFDSHLPDAARRGAELVVGVLIVALGVRLLLRWRAGAFHAHAHHHGAVRHRHLHPHAHQHAVEHEHEHAPERRLGRTPVQAYGIGLVHGVGGSAGVGVLLLAAIPDEVEGIAALLVFGAATAVAMAAASTGFGWMLGQERVRLRMDALVPVMSSASIAFGAWYALGALQAVPYAF